jgi:hypothetical protein
MQDTVELGRRPAGAWLRSLILFIWKPQLLLQILPNPLSQLRRQPAQGRVCCPVNILQLFGWGSLIWQSQRGHRIQYKFDSARFQKDITELTQYKKVYTAWYIQVYTVTIIVCQGLYLSCPIWKATPAMASPQNKHLPASSKSFLHSLVQIRVHILGV